MMKNDENTPDLELTEDELNYLELEKQYEMMSYDEENV
jgi:hypothetical protein